MDRDKLKRILLLPVHPASKLLLITLEELDDVEPGGVTIGVDALAEYANISRHMANRSLLELEVHELVNITRSPKRGVEHHYESNWKEYWRGKKNDRH